MKKVSDLLQESKDESWFEDNIVNNAPLLMAFFANFIVIVADYRAYDVVFQLTSSWWKALSASLACAVPFILWEIGWQYNSTTDGWRKVSLAMAGLAFVTSIFLGVADYLGFIGTWANILLGGVVILTGVHTVVFLLYFYNDPDVARKRHKKQAEASMVNQEINTKLAEQLLASGSNLLATISELEKKYDPEDVEAVLAIIQGKKKTKPTEHRKNQNQPKVAYASVTQQTAPQVQQNTSSNNGQWFSLDAFLQAMSMTKDQAVAKWRGKDYSAFAGEVSQRLEISGKNMRKIFYELFPQPVTQGNGQNF